VTDSAVAATVVAFGEPVQLTEFQLPEPESGGMLVRVDAATLCGTDLHFWHGQEISSDRLPYIPGHETCGTVVAVSGARDDILGEPVTPGERVIWSYPFCRSCFYCTVANQPTLCERAVRFGRERVDQAPYLLGGCASHHYVPPGSSVIKVPDHLSSALAASSACALRTVMHAFERLGDVGMHETVLIQGSGPVGLYAIAASKVRGVAQILVLGAPANRLSIAEQWGADDILNVEEVDDIAERRSWVLERTQGRGPDVAIQCASHAAASEGLDLLRAGGRYLSIGGGADIPVSVAGRALSTKMLTLIGVCAADGRHFYEAVNFLSRHRNDFNFDLLLSGRYELTELTEAFEKMESLTDIKPVIVPAGSNATMKVAREHSTFRGDLSSTSAQAPARSASLGGTELKTEGMSMTDRPERGTRPEAADNTARDSNRRMLIGGELALAAEGREMPVVSPVDGAPVIDVPLAGTEDVDRAVQAAAAAYEAWRWTPLTERRRRLLDLADYVRTDGEALATLDTLVGGHPLHVMMSEVELAASSIEYFAGLAFEWGGRQIPTGTPSIDVALREPYGVIAKLIAFNHPFLFAATKIAAPLLTGNTVVLKVPDQAPLSGLRLGQALAEIFPPGVVNVISGTGNESGDALVRHRLVRKVGFIGSVVTARSILHAVADNIVPSLLELGGKNALIVCRDADAELAANAAVKAMNFKTAGQSCGSFSRLYLQDEIHDDVVALVAKEIADVRVRNPFSPEADMGALISAEARERSERYIESACDMGAELVTGGQRPVGAEFGDGWYLEPALLVNVTATMPVALEEVFGPVLAVSRWSSESAVLAEVNSTSYGLTGGVWSRNLDQALRIAHALEVGTVSVNGDGSQHWPGTPFGGYQQSGYGKEESLDELYESTRLKNLNITVHGSI
jgi:betaine-aldehyde dehydrogenase